MSDHFGLLELPVPVPEEGAAVADPLLDILLDFMRAVVNAEGGDAWAEVCAADPVPVAYVFPHDPDLESFNANETPALYAWRGDDNGAERYSQDMIVDQGAVHVLWVPPPAGQEARRTRESFRNAIKKALKPAFALGRHRAWMVQGDTYYEPEVYGTVLLRALRCGQLRLGEFRPHALTIETVDDTAGKLKFDCLFFTINFLEWYVQDPKVYRAGPLNYMTNAVRLGDPLATDAQRSPLLVVDANVQLALTSIDVATGPAAGGTLVTLTGKQFVEEMEVQFGTALSREVTFINETTVTALAPAHAPGAVDVLLRSISGQEKRLAAAFTYV